MILAGNESEGDIYIYTYEYNDKGLLKKEIAGSSTIEYEYDAFGRPDKIIYNCSFNKVLKYDKDGNLTSASMDGYAPVNISYDNMGRKTQESWTIDGAI